MANFAQTSNANRRRVVRRRLDWSSARSKRRTGSGSKQRSEERAIRGSEIGATGRGRISKTKRRTVNEGSARITAPVRRSARIQARRTAQVGNVDAGPHEVGSVGVVDNTVPAPRAQSRKRQRSDTGEPSAGVGSILKKKKRGATGRVARGSEERRSRSLSWGQIEERVYASDVGVEGGSSDEAKEVCGLCGLERDEFGGVHPFLGSSVMTCSKCRFILMHRVAEPRARECDRTAIDEEKTADIKRGMKADVFAAVIEDMVLQMTTSQAREKDVEDIFKTLLQRKASVTVERLKRLGRYVPHQIVPVICKMLQTIGVDIVDGQLHWPTGTTKMDIDDGMDVLRTALPATLEDVESGRCRGNLTWINTFPDYNHAFVENSCNILVRLLNIIGVKVSLRSCNHQHGICYAEIDGESVKEAMKEAAGWCVEEEMMDIFRQVDRDTLESIYPVKGLEMNLREANIPCESFVGGCCVCGIEKDANVYPLQITKCTGCPSNFCSHCIVSILNEDEEYGKKNNGCYKCVVCRDHDEQSGPSPSSPSSLRSSSSSTAQEESGRSSLFKLTAHARSSMFEHGQNGTTRFREVGFALVTERLNDAVVAGDGVTLNNQDCEVCLSCRNLVHGTSEGDEEASSSQPNRDDGGNGEQGAQQEMHFERGETIRCTVGNCGKLYHLQCLTSEESPRIRVELNEDGIEVRKKWTCSRHYCVDCGERVRSSEAQCITCTNVYCEQHQVTGWEYDPFICDDCDDCVQRPDPTT